MSLSARNRNTRAWLMLVAAPVCISCVYGGPVGGGPTATQYPWPARVLEEEGFGALIVSDSVLGVLVLAKPARSEVPSFSGRLPPNEVRRWARALDSIVLLPSPPTRPFPLSSDGSILAFRIRGAGTTELIFQPVKQRPVHVTSPLEAVQRFVHALDSAATETHGDSGDGPPITHDSLGPVFWLFHDDSVTSLPVALDIPKPHFPPSFREAGVGGFAWLRYVIDAAGWTEPASVQVLWASHPDFARSAVIALQRGRFRPGRYRGGVVRTGVVGTVSFTIGD